MEHISIELLGIEHNMIGRPAPTRRASLLDLKELECPSMLAFRSFTLDGNGV
jgi:hypothetical protein